MTDDEHAAIGEWSDRFTIAYYVLTRTTIAHARRVSMTWYQWGGHDKCPSQQAIVAAAKHNAA